MARQRVVVDPDIDPNGTEPDEGLTQAELDQAAAGDIAMLGDPQFTDYEWSIFRQRTRAEILANPGPAWEFWTKKVGPLDSTEMQIELGGGTFEFRGYFNNGDGNGKVIRRKPIITFAGPRKPSDPTPPPAPAATSQSVPAATDPALVAMLKLMDDRLDRLERQPAPQGTSLKDLAETMVMLDKLRQPSQVADTPDPLATAQGFMDAVRQGIELGQAREPLPADVERGTDWAKILDTAAPILERVFAGAAAARRVQAAPRPAPRAATDSHAEVVNDPPPAPAAEVVTPEMEVARARTMALIDALARAISTQVEPTDFAGTVADILTDDELGMMLSGPPEIVIGELTSMQARYPILGTDAAKAYIGAVLNELRSPTEEQ
jgi:hypothetical protein